MVPEPYELLLLALAAFRIFWLIGEDTITEPVRDWLTARGRREHVELFLSCPWCAGFWISLAVWGCWLGSEKWTLVVSVPLAISALVGAFTTLLHLVIDAA